MSEEEKESEPIIDETPVEKKAGISLELGDIIQITAPSNTELHESTFFIMYINDSKIDLANVSTFHPYVLKLDKNGAITDESIREIALLSRSDEKGYARQHMLVPKTWVNLHFGGEVPVIITGEITNLEEDMIEITTYPDLDVLYIDFEYKGMPEHIPLEQIEIRAKPASLAKISSLINIRDHLEEGEEFEPRAWEEQDASMEFMDTGESVIRLPKSAKPDYTVRDTLHGAYIDANEIVFGDELDEIAQLVEIPEHKKRFGIETQVNDMMDEMLSTIPASKRTKAVMDNIHYLIERYRELRERFSKFDSNGNVYDVNTVGILHKPLVDRVHALDDKIKWLIPIVALRRNIYTDVVPENTPDALQQSISDTLGAQELLHTDYFENRQRSDQPKYADFYKQLSKIMMPVEGPAFSEGFLAPRKTIQSELETVVDNLEDFYSTVFNYEGKKEGYAKRRFVIQKYNLGQTILASQIGKTGRRVYIREQLTPNEDVTVKSIVTLPPPVMKYSKIELPGTSILTKSRLTINPFYMFRLLKSSTETKRNIIKDFSKDYDEEFWKNAGLDIQEFVLDDNLENDPARFRRFLESALPSTVTVIEDVVKNHTNRQLSLKHIIDELEVFRVYPWSITYKHHNSIRYHMKQLIKDFKINTAKRGEEFALLRTMKYAVSQNAQTIENLLHDKRELVDILLEAYRFKTTKEDNNKDSHSGSAEEWMSKILALDNAKMLTILTQYLMSSLITPENLLEALESDERDEMSKNEKIKARDCAVRFLTKRYDTLRDLQKDNGEQDLFYDEDYDDTPYQILKKYKDDQKKHSPEDFVDFLAENLIQKHDCPESQSKELAETLIAGKKRVREGEYAVLEIKPQLPANVDKTGLKPEELKEIEQEAELRKKVQYYRRVKNQWVHDDSIDDKSAFLDNNTFFCNMSKICFKNQTTKQCDSIPSAEERMRQIARRNMIKEFDTRFADSVETIQETLKAEIAEQLRRLSKIHILNEIVAHKYNNYAFELGKYAKTEELLSSPQLALRDKILGQDDFVKKQTDLVRFVEMFCRDPMVDELGDNEWWLYCRETNTPLLPKFMKDLAQTFVSGGNYQQKQDEIARKQGTMSDDGDSIVDRYSGYVIRKIDFVEESGFDDAGFKIVTSEVMEKDAGQVLMDSLLQKGKKDRVFENETAELVFRIYAAISRNIGLPLESVEEFVLRTALELIEKNVKSEASYQKMSDKMEKEKGKRPPPYKTYHGQTVLTIVAAVLLVAIQTETPSFKIRKTFPGCIQSFSGYPADEGSVEDMSGLKYIVCVMKKTESSIEPWNTIQKMPADVLQGRVKTIISDYLISRTDIAELYAKKREYTALHPDETVPAEHAIQKWRGFLPPVVKFTVLKSLKGLSNEYKTELLTLMREGKRDQRDHISIFKTKVLQYGYGLIESVNNVVHGKEMLLKTSSKIPFLENACCNDKSNQTPIQYFATEDETVKPHLKMIEGWTEILSNISQVSKASILYHPKRTGIQRPAVPTEHFTENVYLAFIHYCNLDRDMPIPHELHALMKEKPAGYNRGWTLNEKIEFLKTNGKRYTVGNLMQLMEIVNRANLVGKYDKQVRGNAVSALHDFLEYAEAQDNSIIDRPLCDLLNAVIKAFDPKIMVMDDLTKPQPEVFELNKYLSRANENMLDVIASFLQKHGNLSAKKFAELQTMLADIHIWTLDTNAPGSNDETSMYTVTQFLKNSVYNISRVYPEIIQNNHTVNPKPAKHWNVSPNHAIDIANFLESYYKPLAKFKNDAVIRGLLTDTQRRLVDLTLFLDVIPKFTPIHKTVVLEDGSKENLSWYAFFGKRTAYMLMTYIWYTAICEFIEATDNEDLLYTDVLNRKQERRDKIRDQADPLLYGESEELTTEDTEDQAEDLDELEVQIKMGNSKELKTRVAELLLTFLEIENRSKSEIDASYETLDKQLRRSRQKEKKMITDFLKNLDPDERRVEDNKKALKLGRWNVGMQKGLVKYDKATYERERAEMINQLNGEIPDTDETQVAKGADDLERDAEADADEFYEKEANDIGELDEEYGDGNYYAEDREEE